MTKQALENRIKELELQVSNLKSATVDAQKLHQSEARFHNLIEQSIYPILIFKGEDMILEIANAPMLKIFNVGKEALGKTILEILPEMKDQPFIGLLLDVLHNHITHYGTEQPAYFMRGNGEKEIVYFNYVYQPYHEDDGGISGVMVTAYDVTEQVMARKKIEESEEQLQSLFMQSPFALAYHEGIDFRLNIINEKALQTIGKTLKEVIGKTPQEVVPDAKEQGFIALLEQVYNTGIAFEVKEMPMTIVKEDVIHHSWWDFTYTPISDANGHVKGIISVGIEVTDKLLANEKIRESEHCYHNLVYTSPYMIAIFKGKDMIIDIANDAIIETWGKGKDIFGKSLFEVLPEAAEQGFDKLIQNVYETGEPYHAYEKPVTLLRNGKEQLMHYNFIYQAQRNVDGKIEGVTILANEVTPQVEAKTKIAENDKQQAFLLKLSDALMSLTSPQQIKIKAMQVLGEHLNVSRCYYAEMLKDGKHCLIDNSFSFGLGSIDGTYLLEDFGKAKVAALQQGEVILTADVANDTSVTQEERNSNLEMQIHAYLNVPLVKDNKLICLLGVNQSAVRHWTTLELTIVKETAERTWAAVERAKTEKELWESERQLRKTTAHFEIATTAAEVGIWSLDLASQTLEWSDLHKKMWGYDEHRKDLVYEDWHKVILDSDKEVAFAALAKALETKTPYETSYRIKLDGKEEVRWMRSSGKYLYNDAGEAITLSGISMDITEQKNAEIALKQSEAHFRQMADLMPAKISNAAADGSVIYFNKQWLEFSGYTFEQLRDFGYQQMIHADEIAAFEERLREAAETGNDFVMEMRFKNKDGNYIWHLNTAKPVKDENGKLTLWVGVTTEMQHQKEQREELEHAVAERTIELLKANQDLVKMNKELESFAYISSHDLQEPLRKIRTFASRIVEKEQSNLSDNGKDLFNRMQAAAKRMQTLIDDLLAYSRTKIVDQKFENTDLNKIMAEVKEDLSEELKDKNATIEATELCNANVIPFQFRQLLYNLISNSLKFNHPDHPPHIKIQSEIATGMAFNNKKLLPQNKYCHITVSDNGIGFEPQYSEKIFEVFQRLHGRNQYKGTGIGLAIVKKIVDNHNGIITANGALNEGATFEIYIPAT
jgi:PAS domain S-box-containing protein